MMCSFAAKARSYKVWQISYFLFAAALGVRRSLGPRF